MKIVIDNFENNTLVHHSIIILKGYVDGIESTNHEPINILRNNRKLESSLYEGKFKFLLELNEGSNIFKITFMAIWLEFNVEFAPRTSPYTVVPLYIICDDGDGKFQAPPKENNSTESAQRRIMLGVKILQAALAEKMYEAHLERKTFQLEDACLVYRSKMRHDQVTKLDQYNLWKCLGREIMASDVGSKGRKYVGFISWTRYHGEKFEGNVTTHSGLVDITDGYVAIGGGGLALFHTGCLYTWPKTFDEIDFRFKNSTIVNQREFLDDSNYRSTEWACFSTTLGGVLHEMGHIFDLGHDTTGIMGTQYHDIYKLFTINTRCENSSHEKYPTISQTENDETTWSKHSLEIFNYHKWFNNFLKTDKVYSLKFDTTTQVIRSTNGIRVVEIRRGSEETVLYSWIFNKRILKFYFQIPRETTEMLTGDSVLFAEDNCGNIIRTSAIVAG